MEHHIASLGELAYAQCTFALSTWKISDCMYSHPMKGALDLYNGVVSGKIIAHWVCGHIFTMNKSLRGEMWLNRQTHTHTATTLTLPAHVRCRLMRVSGWHQNRKSIVCGSPNGCQCDSLHGYYPYTIEYQGNSKPLAPCIIYSQYQYTTCTVISIGEQSWRVI